ncbi:MAG: hypothetical protein QFE16_04645 [Pseudomonadota bacterium]|nr:hypothetical protein [Pseudomonadota bacterium]
MPEQIATERAVPPIALNKTGFIAEIDRAPLEDRPCDHVCLRNLFPPDFYRQLLDSLPATEHFHELRHQDALRADGSSTRLRLYLYPEQLWFLPAAVRARWSPLSRLLSSRELQDAFKRKFRRALEARFGRPIEQLNFFAVPIIVRDLPGYRIGIHSDVPKKAITVQFYLPEDDSQKHLGTVFHDGPSGEAALRTRKMPFLPACGYAFPVQQQESWHSAETTTEADGERRSIMLTYYVQNTPKTWFMRRWDRLRSFFGVHPNPKI